MGSFTRRPPCGLCALAAFGLLALACGIDLVGTHADPVDAGSLQFVDAVADDDAQLASGEASAPHESGAFDAPSARPLCDATDPTLIACFPFDGDLVDGSGYAQTLDVQGDPRFETSGARTAVDVDDTLTLHLPNGPVWQITRVSVEMWIKPAKLPAKGERAGLIDKDGSFGVFLHDDGAVECIAGANVRAPIAAVGTWTHIACVADGTSLLLYANGTLVAQAASVSVVGTASYAAIGSNAPSGEHFSGAIDALRAWSRARTAEEIRAAAGGA